MTPLVLRRVFGAGALALAFATLFATFRDPPQTSAPPPPEALRLEHRLADSEALLIRSVSGEPTRRLDRPMSLLGGAAPSEAAPHFARLEIRHPDGSDAHCGGTLLLGGWILTAAHCVAPGWAYVEASVGPERRSDWGRARYRLGEAAIHRLYEGADSIYRHDVALLRLPDDPGGGLAWPQRPQVELEPGERVEVCGMGVTEGGGLSEVLRCAVLPVAEARPAIVRLDGASGGFRQADSGGPARRAATGTPVGIISHFDGADPSRQWIIPFPAAWARDVRTAWQG